MPDTVIIKNIKEFEESCLLIDISIPTENNCLLKLSDKPSLAGYLNPDLMKVNFTCTKSHCIHSVNVCTYAASYMFVITFIIFVACIITEQNCIAESLVYTLNILQIVFQPAVISTHLAQQARSQGFGRFGRTALTKKGPLSCNEWFTF